MNDTVDHWSRKTLVFGCDIAPIKAVSHFMLTPMLDT